MQIFKNLFGKNAKIHVDEIVTKVEGVKQLLGFAIISGWGSNNNGSWIKFGNGFMICYGIVTSSTPATVAHQDSYRTGSTEWYYPQSFVGIPSISRSSESVSWGQATMGEQTTNGERCSFAVLAGVSLPDFFPKVSLTAIGRWK